MWSAFTEASSVLPGNLQFTSVPPVKSNSFIGWMERRSVCCSGAGTHHQFDGSLLKLTGCLSFHNISYIMIIQNHTGLLNAWIERYWKRASLWIARQCDLPISVGTGCHAARILLRCNPQSPTQRTRTDLLVIPLVTLVSLVTLYETDQNWSKRYTPIPCIPPHHVASDLSPHPQRDSDVASPPLAPDSSGAFDNEFQRSMTGTAFKFLLTPPDREPSERSSGWCMRLPVLTEKIKSQKVMVKNPPESLNDDDYSRRMRSTTKWYKMLIHVVTCWLKKYANCLTKLHRSIDAFLQGKTSKRNRRNRNV